MEAKDSAKDNAVASNSNKQDPNPEDTKAPLNGAPSDSNKDGGAVDADNADLNNADADVRHIDNSNYIQANRDIKASKSH